MLCVECVSCAVGALCDWLYVRPVWAVLGFVLRHRTTLWSLCDQWPMLATALGRCPLRGRHGNVLPTSLCCVRCSVCPRCCVVLFPRNASIQCALPRPAPATRVVWSGWGEAGGTVGCMERTPTRPGSRTAAVEQVSNQYTTYRYQCTATACVSVSDCRGTGMYGTAPPLPALQEPSSNASSSHSCNAGESDSSDPERSARWREYYSDSLYQTASHQCAASPRPSAAAAIV